MSDLNQAAFDLVDRIAAANSVSGVWSVYLGAAARVGLDKAVACFVPRDPTAEFQLIANALPKGCWEGYIDNHLYHGDLLAARIRASIHTFHWRITDWDADHMTPVQKRWRDHCLMYDLSGGLCVLDFRRDAEILLALCGPDGALDRADCTALDFSGQEVVRRLRELTDATPAATLSLSRRERECLEWVAAGKTDWEIAQILSLSEKTVNIYIDRAKAKFSVKSRAQAVVLASRAGLIST
jgi:DNA-binding CsgD family transcriptional regulator